MATLVATLALATGGCAGLADDGDPAKRGEVAAPGAEATTPSGMTGVAKDVMAPFDATPDPTGKTVYYTALAKEPGRLFGTKLGGALFRAVPGGAPVKLASGFSMPIGVVTSTDGARLFVADSAYAATTTTPGLLGRAGVAVGMVFTVPAKGGTPIALSTTEGFMPRGLDLVREGKADTLYFTGTDPRTRKPGIFKVGATGGPVSVVYAGAPLKQPSGLSVTKSGTIYVVDAASAWPGRGRVLAISATSQRVLTEGLRTGYPAGIALASDGAGVIVSAQSATGAGAAFFRVDVTSGALTQLTPAISKRTWSGGLHRAHAADRYAWANASHASRGASTKGAVYLIGTKASPLR